MPPDQDPKAAVVRYDGTVAPGLTPADHEQLAVVPFVLWTALTASRRLMEIEVAVVLRCVAATPYDVGSVAGGALTWARHHGPGLARRHADDPRTVAAELVAASDVLARLPVIEAEEARRVLATELGVRLVLSLGPMGQATRTEDLQRLRVARELLGPRYARAAVA